MNDCFDEWSVVGRPLPKGGGCKDTAHSVRWTGRKMTNHPSTQAPDFATASAVVKSTMADKSAGKPEKLQMPESNAKGSLRPPAVSLQFALIRLNSLGEGAPLPPRVPGVQGKERTKGTDRTAGTAASGRFGSRQLGLARIGSDTPPRHMVARFSRPSTFHLCAGAS